MKQLNILKKKKVWTVVILERWMVGILKKDEKIHKGKRLEREKKDGI